MPGASRIRRIHPRHIVSVGLILLSLVILSISTGTLEPASEVIGVTVIGGLQRGMEGIGLAMESFFSSFGDVRRLRQEKEALQLQIQRFEAMERSVAEIRMENERLRDQLGFSERIGYQRRAARIIAKDSQNRYFTLTIDKGSLDGIARNMAVVAFQSGIEGVVGKVVAVGARTAMVTPVNDSRFAAAARISSTRSEGLVTGRGSELAPLLLKYVPKTAAASVQFGDLVVTSGYESVFPPDIAIGRVRKVSMPDYLTSAEIELDRVLDFSRIEYVFVVDISKPVELPAFGDARVVDQDAAPDPGKESP